MKRSKLFVCFTTALGVALSFSTFSGVKEAHAKWWRGQLHVHTNLTEPAQAVSWYKYHGYNFAVITDLNYATPVEGLKLVYDAPGRFIVIPGIELNVEVPTLGDRINDTEGYGGDPSKITKFRDPETYWISIPQESAADTYNRQGQMIREVGGIPAITHPNLNWSGSLADILKTDPKVIKHLEIDAAEPGMNDEGGGGYPSTEEMWDGVLSTGRIMYGVAADDSHHFPGTMSSQSDSSVMAVWADAKLHKIYPALPGRTSVYVQAKELKAEAIIEAIDRGDFYAVSHALTMPIEFKSYEVDAKGIRIELPTPDKDIGWSLPGKNPTRYRTFFIGKGGKVLKMDESVTPSYNFAGDELYVRARVKCSDGSVAYTQPVFVKR